jgi:uncharacterized integral membrane protein
MNRPEPRPSGGIRLGGGAIASIGAAAVLVLFIAQNTDNVTFDFLWLSVTWPLWLYTIIVAGCGALVWVGVGVARRRSRRSNRRETRGEHS